MTEQEINIIIAEACGWKRKNPKKLWEWTPTTEWWEKSRYAKAYYDDRDGGILYPPDYYNGLDAIQEAIEKLWHNDSFWYSYITELEKLTGQDLALRTRTLLHATSQQRAVAIVKAISKWKD